MLYFLNKATTKKDNPSTPQHTMTAHCALKGKFTTGRQTHTTDSQFRGQVRQTARQHERGAGPANPPRRLRAR